MPGYSALGEIHVSEVEQTLDGFNAGLPALKDFILPAGSRATACCHLARTICRRAERRVATLDDQESVNPWARKYLNRLSDLLFVLARVIARADGGEEVLWQKGR